MSIPTAPEQATGVEQTPAPAQTTAATATAAAAAAAAAAAVETPARPPTPGTAAGGGAAADSGGAATTVEQHTAVLLGDGGGFRALEALRGSGTIRAFGAGVNCPADVMATGVAGDPQAGLCGIGI